MSRKGIQVIILAAGDARRFNGVLKQILPIGKETILQRMVRQSSRFSIVSPVVVTHQTELINYCQSALNIQTFTPQNRSVTCETFLNTESIWKDRNVVLLGDVIYSNRVIDDIFKVALNSNDTVVFGDVWEIFAIIFSDSDRKAIVSALDKAIANSQGKLRHFYFVYCGFDLHKKVPESKMLGHKVFRHVKDWTRDIDMLTQYQNAIRELVMQNMLDK